MPKYDQVYREEPHLYDIGKLARIACCDCGLVHGMIFKVKDKKHIEVTTFDANRSTGQMRRHGDCKLMKRGGSWGYKMRKVAKRARKNP